MNDVEWRCLTVRQWWTWAMVYAGKHVENRARGALAWRYWIGNLVGIHAAQQVDVELRGRLSVYDEETPRWAFLRPREIGADRWESELQLARAIRDAPPATLDALAVRSAIVGTARLVDVHLATSDCCPPWGENWYRWSAAGGRPAHLVFEDVQPVSLPIDATGRLGLWVPGPDLLAELRKSREETAAGSHRRGGVPVTTEVDRLRARVTDLEYQLQVAQEEAAVYRERWSVMRAGGSRDH